MTTYSDVSLMIDGAWTKGAKGRTIPIALGAIFLLAVFAAQYLQYIKNWANLRKQVEQVLVRRPFVQFALLQVQLIELELERCNAGAEFWPLFDLALRRVGFIEDIAAHVGEFLTIQVKWNGTKHWVLYAPQNVGSQIEWQRVAECFRPVYAKAMSKWSR